MTTPKDEPMFEISLDDYRREVRAAGLSLTAARKRVDNCSDTLQQRVRHAIGAGMSENEAAKLAGVTRQTVRAWMGK